MIWYSWLHEVLIVDFFPQNLLNVVANKCFEIATDKTGCCVLQPCINHAQGEIKKKLIAAVMLYASLLAEDCYGSLVFVFCIMFFLFSG